MGRGKGAGKIQGFIIPGMAKKQKIWKGEVSKKKMVLCVRHEDLSFLCVCAVKFKKIKGKMTISRSIERDALREVVETRTWKGEEVEGIEGDDNDNDDDDDDDDDDNGDDYSACWG